VIEISAPNDTFLAHCPGRPGSSYVCDFNPFQPWTEASPYNKNRVIGNYIGYSRAAERSLRLFATHYGFEIIRV
jgi:hypothetical protein